MSDGFGRPPAAPPGLEPLVPLDRLLVKQQLELWEAVTGWETNNRYTVHTAEGAAPLFRAAERSSCWLRLCCGPLRALQLLVLDEQRREVLHLRRPLRCTGCCSPCCMQRLEVSAADGRPLGAVTEQRACLRPHLTLHRPDGELALTVRGPRCPLALCRDVKFTVESADGSQQLGTITKQWGGLARELLTDADTLELTFPVGLDAELKALLLGALFLVDYMYFESNR
ncbi:Phospholipid scramblase 2 [Amphibalanus amphitrite]|uniref:Phospholipid scramblase n=1 Tax=Amphibalanus amphitrite TaxID=1232801 RepID=A0A6A4WJB4_AMPAM|nr:Phospholipid scramblase 2 [Amphibalanus amphitrite]